MSLAEFLNSSYTAYQAVVETKRILNENGFVPLLERETWNLQEGGKYYVERNGSSLIAFKVCKGEYFKIIASHTDSPCLKLKENPNMKTENMVRWNVEGYGGGIWYSFLDRPLKVAGRIVVKDEKGLKVEPVVSNFNVTIPSLAIHMNRGVNEGFAINAQTDLMPLVGLGNADLLKSMSEKEIVSYDLYVVPAEKAFVSGVHGEFISSPRIDNLSSVYGSMVSLCQTEGDGITICAIFDNEEVGSLTMQGAASDFLRSTTERIAKSMGFSLENAYAKSMMISLDNAHSIHPNHPEKCDPTNHPKMGGGIVIKYHANKAYTTDAVSSAIIKTIFDEHCVTYQSFFNRSDMRSGGTLGSISQGKVSVLSADLGLAQLAMHSATECLAYSDFEMLVKGLSAFYATHISLCGDQISIL